MTTLRDAAQQALEALKMMRDEYGEYACPACDHADAAIYALKAALAEPPTNQCGETCERAKLCAACARELAEPVQEPVAVRWRHPRYRWTYEDYKPGQFYGPRVEVQRLYTAPPQRKPLTEETMRECAKAMDAEPLAEGWHELSKFARAIERAHGIGGQHEP